MKSYTYHDIKCVANKNTKFFVVTWQTYDELHEVYFGELSGNDAWQFVSVMVQVANIPCAVSYKSAYEIVEQKV